MKDEHNNSDRSDLNRNFCASAQPTLTIDVEKYQAMLDGSGHSPEQRQQVLEALWTIIVGFIDLGFEVHPAQEVCGKDEQIGTQPAIDAFDAVRLGKPEPN